MCVKRDEVEQTHPAHTHKVLSHCECVDRSYCSGTCFTDKLSKTPKGSDGDGGDGSSGSGGEPHLSV